MSSYGARYERAWRLFLSERFICDVIMGTVRWDPAYQKKAEESAHARHAKRVDEYFRREVENINRLEKSLVRVLSARFGKSLAPAKRDIDEIFEDYTKQELKGDLGL